MQVAAKERRGKVYQGAEEGEGMGMLEVMEGGDKIFIKLLPQPACPSSRDLSPSDELDFKQCG